MATNSLRRAINTVKGIAPLARALGINRQAIHKWTRIPAERVIEVERVTGIPREELRPDLYLAPRPKHVRQRTSGCAELGK